MAYEYMQRGGSLPVFRGARTQRGYGLGSMLKGILRSAIPLHKRRRENHWKESLKDRNKRGSRRHEW